MNGQSMNDVIERIAELRRQGADALERYWQMETKVKSDLKKDPLYTELVNQAEQCDSEIKSLRVKLLEMSLDGQTHEAVTQVTNTTYVLAGDEERRKAWVKENAPMLLIVNEKGLINLAKDPKNNIPLDIVQPHKHIDIKLKGDLSAYLTKAK